MEGESNMSTKHTLLKNGSAPHEVIRSLREKRETIAINFHVYTDKKVDVVLEIAGQHVFYQFESKLEANAFVKRLKISKRYL